MTDGSDKLLGQPPVKGAAPNLSFYRYGFGQWTKKSGSVPEEMALTVFINGDELATILCTPSKLLCLVYGFLYAEGIISGLGDVATLRLCEDDSVADVRLANAEYKPPARHILSSGCGGGVTFSTEVPKVDVDLSVTPEEVLSLMKQLSAGAELYRAAGGVHTSALGDNKKLLVAAEDIGRHNTLDKVLGECLLTGVETRGRLLLTTGRISSEMIGKAARMGTPIVVSRSSPTARSISLAQELGITLVGYARGPRLSVYTHEQRLRTS